MYIGDCMRRIFFYLVLSFIILSFGCNEKEEDFVDTVVVDESGTNEIIDDSAHINDYEKEINRETYNNLPPVQIESTEQNASDELPKIPDDEETEIEEFVETPSANIRVEEIKLTTYSVTLHVGEKKMPIVTMFPQDATDKGEIWESSDVSIATVDGLGNIKAVSKGECTVTVTSTDNPDVSASVSVTVLPQPEQKNEENEQNTEQNIECTYIDGILVVNKTYPLPPDYAPGWETEASGPLWEMIAAAKKDGIELWMKSGYRSYYDQKYIYNGYVKRDGQEEADKYSARPGHSEHQTGLAYDLNSLDVEFGDTPEGIWIAENCYKYGFILRYPKGKEEITGYMYEPWHVRYVGVEKAKEIFESGLCLEEFLNITSVYAE